MPNVNIQTPDWLRQMESILEELNEGVAIVDDQLRVVFANEALLRLGMYSREEIRGQTPDAIFPAKDIPYLLRQHESGHRYGRSRSEFYLPRKNGERIPAIFSGRSIQGPDGQEYVLLIVTDISAQKRVEEQLRESNAQLEKRQMEIEAELSLAARVQQSLAPQSLVWNDVSVETYYNPARTIGGDFGVVFPHSDEVLTVLMCDVSGHGIGAALMANRIYSETLHQLERKAGPGIMLRRVHDFVHDRHCDGRLLLHYGCSTFQSAWAAHGFCCRRPSARNARFERARPSARFAKRHSRLPFRDSTIQVRWTKLILHPATVWYSTPTGSSRSLIITTKCSASKALHN